MRARVCIVQSGIQLSIRLLQTESDKNRMYGKVGSFTKVCARPIMIIINKNSSNG